jgi:hypothetical protein
VIIELYSDCYPLPLGSSTIPLKYTTIPYLKSSLRAGASSRAKRSTLIRRMVARGISRVGATKVHSLRFVVSSMRFVVDSLRFVVDSLRFVVNSLRLAVNPLRFVVNSLRFVTRI